MDLIARDVEIAVVRLQTTPFGSLLAGSGDLDPTRLRSTGLAQRLSRKMKSNISTDYSSFV